MAKSSQLVFRIEDDLREVLDECSEAFKQSRATLVNAALHLFAELPPKERREALIRYLTRDIPQVAGEKGKKKKTSRRKK
ncbi:hypothetical protein ACFL59_09815 [Planctomycetota bacterium]